MKRNKLQREMCWYTQVKIHDKVLCKLRDQIISSTCEKARELIDDLVWEKVWRQVHWQVYIQIRERITEQAHAQLNLLVRNRVYWQVMDGVRDRISDQHVKLSRAVTDSMRH